MSNYLFTSESVSEGHPHKHADQISLAVPDALVAEGRTAPAAGQLTVRLNGGEREIGERAAAGLFVRPA